MIKNSKELKKAKENLEGFKKSLDELYQKRDSLHPFEFTANENASLDLIKDAEREIKEFESLKRDGSCLINMESIHDLGKVLIKVRIAHGLTQEDLGKRLGLDQQQIHRYESFNYESIKWARMLEIIDALGINLYNNKIVIKEQEFKSGDEYSIEKIQEASIKIRERKQLLAIAEN